MRCSEDSITTTSGCTHQIRSDRGHREKENVTRERSMWVAHVKERKASKRNGREEESSNDTGEGVNESDYNV